jgi:hypothetical protein
MPAAIKTRTSGTRAQPARRLAKKARTTIPPSKPKNAVRLIALDLTRDWAVFYAI